MTSKGLALLADSPKARLEEIAFLGKVGIICSLLTALRKE